MEISKIATYIKLEGEKVLMFQFFSFLSLIRISRLSSSYTKGPRLYKWAARGRHKKRRLSRSPFSFPFFLRVCPGIMIEIIKSSTVGLFLSSAFSVVGWGKSAKSFVVLQHKN